MKTRIAGLVGDIGGTNARLALVDEDGHIRHPRTFAAADHGSLIEVVGHYLDAVAGGKVPPRAVLAVAGPVLDGEISFTNLDWRISEGELVGTFGFEVAKLVNDFAAQALAAPALGAADLVRLGPDLKGAPDAPIVVLGAGTGFGVAGLARSDTGEIALETEGGHASLAPNDATEDRLIARLRVIHGRVSIERVLSGQGLYDLYLTLAEGTAPAHADEKAVMAAGLAQSDPLAVQTLDRFCAILGSVAGDLALTFGARGGVYIAGGLAPRLKDHLMGQGFRARFEAKGRMSDYVRDIPTRLMVHPYAALVGAARALALLGRLRL